MEKPTYFYHFLNPLSKQLANVARELEHSIYTSPRTMLTHARAFVENILQLVIRAEKLPEDPRTNLKDRLDLLDTKGYLTPEIRDALHFVRKSGNQAAHDTRQFRYSEALLSWEEIYKIVKWYVEVYGPVEFKVPAYQDPSPKFEQAFDITELEVRLKSMEELLLTSLHPSVVHDGDSESEEESSGEAMFSGEPGFTTIRTLTYKHKKLNIPYFLRDAFLMPQRFDKSETFLIRLGAEQEARLMSELPNNLEDLHLHVKRFNASHDENLFFELGTFIEQESSRRIIKLDRPSELFFFYEDDYLVVTEKLATTPIDQQEFVGFPSLIQQLNEKGYHTVGQLPSELVTLAKYKNSGKATLEKFFAQLKEK